MSARIVRHWLGAFLLLGMAIGGCRAPAARPPALGPVAARPDLNEEIASAALASIVQHRASDYLLGPGDMVEIDVFQAEELDRTLRVRPDGTISLPLLGVLPVAGETTAGLEALLTRRLGERYLNDPQISVFVREYRAHPVSVLGEVREPGVRYLREPTTLLAMLSESGGLSEDASAQIQLRRADPGGGIAVIPVDLQEVLTSSDPHRDPLLQGGDTVFVPTVGTVFVEGAVQKPGAYTLHGAGSVLKAVTMAGGLDVTAKKSSVQVVRARRGEPEVVHVDLGAARNDPSLDATVYDGDLILVGADPVKVGLVGLWRGITGLVRLSTGVAF